MTELIQFLMKNFYIVLFVLFILSRFMGKSSGGKRNEQRMPNFGGDETAHTEAPAEVRARVQQVPNHRDKQSAAQQTVYRSRLETSESQPEGGFGVPEADPYAAETQRRSSSRSAPASKSRPSFASLGGGASRSEMPAPDADKGLSKHELRNAFIWSEVLGPPKSKRTYRK